MEVNMKTKLRDMQSLLSKMSLELCCLSTNADFGLRWRDVSKAVRNARLAMAPASVATVLTHHAARTMEYDEVVDILGKLRLKLTATQHRTWHLLSLHDPISDDEPQMHQVVGRIAKSLKNTKLAMRQNMAPDVQEVRIGDYMFLSLQLVSEARSGPVLYVSLIPGEPLLFTVSLNAKVLLKACVEGLGYARYEDESLSGPAPHELLRLYRAPPPPPPSYSPTPVRTHNGIDYTNQEYDAQYIEQLHGPDPPRLTALTVESEKMFFEPALLRKKIKMKVVLSSDDVSSTLKRWVREGIAEPQWEWHRALYNLRTNRFHCYE